MKLESLEDDGRKYLSNVLTVVDVRSNFFSLQPCLFITADFRNGWVIRTATKSFAVYAATNTEKQEWMAHINKCIEDLLRKSNYSVISC